jgi:hypothetical protein
MTAGFCWPMFDNAFEWETVLLRMAIVEVYTASHFTRAPSKEHEFILHSDTAVHLSHTIK